MANLEGRVAIVTGASKGIGRACAEALISAGATVVGCSRTSPAGDELDHDRFYHRTTDVAIPSQIEELVDWTSRTFGRIDVLVNNAGTHPPTKAIDAFSVDEFDAIVRLNLRSVFVACRAAIPLIRQTQGSIINMGSAVGLYGQEGAAIYCATKAGISGLTKSIAIDEAPNGVRANTVCPAAILTPMAEDLHPADRRRKIESWSWMNRWGTPDEVAALVLFLAGDDSRFMTGQDLVLGGGAELGYGLKGREYYRTMES